MPLTETIQNQEFVQPTPNQEGFDPGQHPFFLTLFRALDQHGVRYCALRAQGGLLYGADFAVHPGDKKKLRMVFLELKQAGYLAVQWIEIQPGEHRIVFTQTLDSKPETVAIALLLGGQLGAPAERIIEQRRRVGIFWAAAAENSPPQNGNRSHAPIPRGGLTLRDRFPEKAHFLYLWALTE